MRISIEDALAWGAVSQSLAPAEGCFVPATPAAAAMAVGGLTAQPNHAPVVSLTARLPGFCPEDLSTDQSGWPRQMARIAGLRNGRVLAPLERIPALARLAMTTAKTVSDEAIEPLAAEEVTAAVRWICQKIDENGGTYPEIRTGAPAALLRHVERGSTRALHQETALQQVLLALDARGDLVSTLEAGVNTSEGPYRYYLRSQVTPEKVPNTEEAYGELAEWYVHAYAPIEPRDFASWTGLSEGVCRRAIGAIRDPLRPVEIAGLGENFLAPESFLDRAALSEPVCVLLPWVDGWLQSYRTMERFLRGELPGAVTPRDLVFLSLGPGVRSGQSLAARVGVVGSAREPRFRPEPWRPLAAHEAAALQASLEQLDRLFTKR